MRTILLLNQDLIDDLVINLQLLIDFFFWGIALLFHDNWENFLRILLNFAVLFFKLCLFPTILKNLKKGAAVAAWLSSWLAEQEVRVPIPASLLEFSEIGYLLLPRRDMTERPLKRRKSSIQPTNQPIKTKKNRLKAAANQKTSKEIRSVTRNSCVRA